MHNPPTMQAMEAARLHEKGREVWTLDGNGEPMQLTDSWAKAIRGFGFHIIASLDKADLLGGEWWIERPSVSGGDLGPFATRELAFTVRSYVEATAQGATYSVASR